MMNALEKSVAAILIQQPELWSPADIDFKLFSSEKIRRIIKACLKYKENGKGYDEALLSDEAGINFSEIFDITKGEHRKTREHFELYLEKLRIKKLEEKFFREVEEQKKFYFKNMPVDLEPAHSLLKEIHSSPKKESEAVMVNLSDVEAQEVSWLWPNRLPLGKLSLLVGDPGVGKSFFSEWLSCQISKGWTWPDGETATVNGKTIILTGEDGLADTLRPRCDAMGGDASKIKVIKGVLHGEEIDMFNFTKHIKTLEAVIAENPETWLLVADPISSFLGYDLDSHRDNEVRTVLSGLSALAEKYQFSALLISHFNKNQAAQAIYRAMGSIAFMAAVRSAWAIVRDPEDENKKRRLFMPLKTNLSIDPTTLAFHIIDGKIIFESDPVNVDIEGTLSSERREENSALSEAVNWLREALNDGPILSEKIYKMAADNKISERTLQRARNRLKVKCRKQGFGDGGKWEWSLGEAR